MNAVMFKTPLAIGIAVAGLALSGAASADTHGMEQRLAELEARIAAAEQRAADAEQRATLAETRAESGARPDADEVEERLARVERQASGEEEIGRAHG